MAVAAKGLLVVELNWIHSVQVTVRWQACVGVVVNLHVP
jgi:hypothetical protein